MLRCGIEESAMKRKLVPHHSDWARSSMAMFYGIAALPEAPTHLAHRVLGPRLEVPIEAPNGLLGDLGFYARSGAV